MSLRPLPPSAPVRRRLPCGALLLLLASSAWAQPAIPPGPAKKDEAAEAAQAAYRNALGNAKALAKANHLAAAEQALAQLNLALANTAEWHLETAQRLVQLAEQVARDGAPANVAPLVRQALQQLALAEQRATTPGATLNAKLLAGFIHERFLADAKSALASYQAAVQLAPDSAEAKEKSERMQKTDDTFRRKPKNSGS